MYKNATTPKTLIHDVPFTVRQIFRYMAQCMENELMHAIVHDIEISISTATNSDKIHYTVHGKLDDVEMNGAGWIAQPEFTFEFVSFGGQFYVKSTFDTAMSILRSMKLQKVDV